MLKTDDKSIDFILKDQSGDDVKLSSFYGSWIILYFYPKDDTPGCTTEACDFNSNINDFKKIDAVIIGISPDSTKSHKKFSEKYSLSFSLLSDTDHTVIEKYDSWKLKKMAGKEYMGVSRSTFIIDPEGTIKAIWHDVSAKEHAKEVKEKLKILSQK